MKPSLSSRLLAGAITLSGTRGRQFAPKRFTGAPSSPADYQPPRAVRRSTIVTEREHNGWPVFEIAPRSGATGHKAMYLHGGAWAAEIRGGHWSFIAKLAIATSRTFVVPIFPLVPAVTHRDVGPVLQELWSMTASDSPTALLGDSSGAAMALNLLTGLPEGSPKPDATVLLSPALDLALSNPKIEHVAPRDPLLRADHLRELASLYAGADGVASGMVNPMVAPLDELGDLAIFTGTRDLHDPDVDRFAQRVRDARGTRLTVNRAEHMIHDWMLMPSPEAKVAITAIADLLRSAAATSSGIDSGTNELTTS